MKKLWLIVVVMMSFGLTACTNDKDFETYVSDLMYMYDDIETGLEEFLVLQDADNLSEDLLLEELLILYSDLSVKLGVATEELELIGRYGSDKFLYNAAYEYLNSVQSLYQNDLHEFVMLYAKYKQNAGNKADIEQELESLLRQIGEKSKNYDSVFENDLGKFIIKYEKLN